MTKQLTEPTYRAFSTKKESTYGSSIAWGSAAPYLVKFMDKPTLPLPADISTDKDEYTGKAHITEWTIRRWAVELAHSRRLMPHEAALFLSLCLGSVSSAQQGATAAYKHTITPISGYVLPSVTMWEANPTVGNKVFAGIGCSQVEISCAREDFARIAANLIGDGSIATGVDISGGSYPASEAYLDWSDLDVKIGGTFNGTSVSGGTSIKTLIRDLTLTVKNNARANYLFGNTDGYADELIIPDKKLDDWASLAVTIEPEDATEINYLLNETENVLEFIATGAVIEDAYTFEIDVIFPVSRVTEASLEKDGTMQTVPLLFHALKDDSANDYPIVYAWVQNKVTEYLGTVA